MAILEIFLKIPEFGVSHSAVVLVLSVLMAASVAGYHSARLRGEEYEAPERLAMLTSLCSVVLCVPIAFSTLPDATKILLVLLVTVGSPLAVFDYLYWKLPTVLIQFLGFGYVGVAILAASQGIVPWSGVWLVAGISAGLFALFLVMTIVSRNGFGIGDTRLIPVLFFGASFVVGITEALTCLFFAFVLFLVWSVARKRSLGEEAPLGPALLLSFLVTPTALLALNQS